MSGGIRLREGEIENRLTKRQLATQTLRQNLSILYDEFSESIGHSCYRELVRLRLPVRLRQARRRLEEIEASPDILDRMQSEVLRRRMSWGKGIRSEGEGFPGGKVMLPR